MKDKKHFYLVGNAHLDPVWQWKWQEGSAEAKATIRSALDRMNEFEDFKFVCSSASVYKWVKEFDSEMFEDGGNHGYGPTEGFVFNLKLGYTF